METIHLYRRRYMPDETVELKDDLILYRDDNILVTKWNILKPRKDIDHGISVYYMKDGFKISKSLMPMTSLCTGIVILSKQNTARRKIHTFSTTF
jgi:hypothetical protein